MFVKAGWKKDFIVKDTPVPPISGWMGDDLRKSRLPRRSPGVDHGIVEGLGDCCERFRDYPLRYVSRCVWQDVLRSGTSQSMHQCGCPFLGPIRSKMLTISLRSPSCRVWTSLAKRLSSYRHILGRIRAAAKCSLLRCIIRARNLPILGVNVGSNIKGLD